MNLYLLYLNGISNVVYEGRDNIFKSFTENLYGIDTSTVWNEAVNNTKNYLKNEDKEVIKMLR